MSVFTLYSNPQSRGNSTLWLLEECQADYQVVNIPFGEAMKSAEFLVLNPVGKVPVLKHGDTVLIESSAINLYIAEQFPEKALIPSVGSAERGELYRWLCFSAQLEYAMLNQYFDIPSSPEYAKSIGYGTFEQSITTLRNHLADRKYVVGEQFTVLDIMITALLGWGIRLIKVLPEDDAVYNTYLSQHTARPAFAKMLELANVTEM